MTPTLSKAGTRLYDSVEPLTRDDAANGWPLAYYSNGFAAMLDPVATLVSEQDDGTPGYAWLFDPDTAPLGWLPYLEFFAGVTPYPAVDEAGRRLRIQETDGRRRGTPSAIKGAARQFLTGTKYVAVIPRNGAPTHYTVVVRAVEIPAGELTGVSWDSTPGTWDTLGSAMPWQPAILFDALVEQKPAGFTFDLIVAAGQVWNEVATTTWDTVSPAGRTWDDLVGTSTI